jgi:multiple sugar transport system substrate-binding protein
MDKRSLSRRDFLRYSLVGATGLALAACVPAAPQAGAGGQAGTSGADAETVTLRYVYVADPGELEVREACIADFQAKNPHIKIDGELVPEEGMGEKILTQLAGGAAPDLVYFNNTPLPLYATQNVLIPLNDYADRDAATFVPDDFFAGPLGDMSRDGKIYGFPYYSGPWMIIYNKSLFDELGVPYPTTFAEGYQDGSDEWTWDNLLVLAQQLVSGEGMEKTWGYFTPRSLAVAVNSWMASNGAQPWTDDTKTCLLNSPESVEAHQFQVDMFVKYQCAPSQSEFEGMPDNFKTGKIGMYRMLRAAAPGYKDITFELGEVVQPKGPAGRFTVDGPNAVGILSSCQFKDEAWEFCRYLPGDKPGTLGGQEFEFKASRSVPTRKSNFESPVFAENLLPWEDAAVYQASAEAVINTRRPGRWSEIDNAWREQWDAMRLGKPVQAALDELTSIVQPMLEEV